MLLKYFKIEFHNHFTKRGTWRCIFALHNYDRKRAGAAGSEEEQGELRLYNCANGRMRRVKKKVVWTWWGLYALELGMSAVV